jgi:mannitol operon transcriptional antiterminator
MCYLTSRQYSLLKILLEVDKPLSMGALSRKIRLTSRQVDYNLQGVQNWLKEYQAAIRVTPGVGVSLDCTLEQRQVLANKLVSEKDVRLVLSVDERCQMLALILLTANESMILANMQRLAGVTRSTVLKDLDVIEAWLKEWDGVLERKPNLGYWVNISEAKRRQLIQALLWGHSSFGEPLTIINYKEGLKFAVQMNTELLPLVTETSNIIRAWNTRRRFITVAFAEAQLGGRFTDEAVLHLGLAFAIQAQRVQQEKYVEVNSEQLTWLQNNPFWCVAVKIAQRLASSPYEKWPEGEIASIVMYLLSAARNERWPGDLEMDKALEEIILSMIQTLAQNHRDLNLEEDRVLFDGLVNLLVPAYYLDKFTIWQPASSTEVSMIEHYAADVAVAAQMAEVFFERTGVKLSNEAIAGLAMLIRAAVLREQADRQQQVLVICPSGMATAQLLVARLKVYFPGLGMFKVISMRDLTPQVAATARFILTTVPLPAGIAGKAPVLQVHPLLMPENIAAITKLLG